MKRIKPGKTKPNSSSTVTMAGSLLCLTHLGPRRSRPAPSLSSTWRFILFAATAYVVVTASESDKLSMIASAPRQAGAVLLTESRLESIPSRIRILDLKLDWKQLFQYEPMIWYV